MPKIDNSSTPSFDMAGVTFTSIAAPSRGSTENGIWRAKIAPGEGVLHHMTREEIIVAVAGEGRVRMAGEIFALRPGDAFAVPAFTEFRLESGTTEPFEAMVVLPAGGRAVIGDQPSFQPPWSV